MAFLVALMVIILSYFLVFEFVFRVALLFLTSRQLTIYADNLAVVRRGVGLMFVLIFKVIVIRPLLALLEMFRKRPDRPLLK